MKRRIIGAIAVGVGLLLVGLLWRSPAQEESAGGPRPGLIVTYRDAAPPPGEFTTLEPGIALALKATEAPHPRLAAEQFTARWEGQLNILRPAKYRFSVHLRGKFRLTIGGKEVLAATGDGTTLHQGEEIELHAGPHPLVAEFTKLPGAARVQVLWEALFFHREPLPHDVVGHLPKQVVPQLAIDQLVERGRMLAEEHSCTACHQPADGDAFAKGLQNRRGPDLSKAGERFATGAAYPWLMNPQQYRPHSNMPKLFRDDQAGRIEATAVGVYLGTLGKRRLDQEDKITPNELRASMNRGEKLFLTVGCAACHSVPGQEENAASPKHALRGVSGRKGKEHLTRYLLDPLAYDPSGRMPNMLLSAREASDLARYLSQDAFRTQGVWFPVERNDALKAFKRLELQSKEDAAFADLPTDMLWPVLGQRLVMEKRCNACHTIAPDGKPFAQIWAKHDFDEVRAVASQDKGCLADQPDAAPRFAFTKEDKQALRAFLTSTPAKRHTPAPTYEARLTLERFNCLACHAREGQGGLSTEMIDTLRKFESADNAEAISPPPLTGVGAKLHTPWLGQVLTQAGRARPWMGLRMPQFGAANVGHLPEGLAACDGVEPSDKVHQVAYEPKSIETGRTLVGKKAFGCIACHDIAGQAASGTRGPDLALMQQRVRYDWYRRWLEQPQKMQPGTRMPTIFPNGKSLMDDVLGGQADAQAEAMWGYLALGLNLPLPEGLEPPKGLVLTVADKPVVLRTFLPDAGTRAIAVGYPDQINIAFDAQQCRLAYAWSGNFLDASPVWNDRGGNPAKPLGPRFWESPRGFPWAFTTGGPPDFAKQATDPAFGAALPEGKVYQGPMRLRFDGYVFRGLPWSGIPTFSYEVIDSEDKAATIREFHLPLRKPAGIGLTRCFGFRAPTGRRPWFLAGISTREPRLLDEKGNEIALDFQSSKPISVPAGKGLIVLSQAAGEVIVLEVPRLAKANWFFVRQGSEWLAIVQLPEGTADSQEFSLTVWRPYRNDPAMIRELLK